VPRKTTKIYNKTLPYKIKMSWYPNKPFYFTFSIKQKGCSRLVDYVTTIYDTKSWMILRSTKQLKNKYYINK
jgi:hypothetical protein